MAELRNYNPTLRERLNALIMGDAPTNERRRFANALTGNAEQAGLLDVTPVGALTGLQEAYRAGDTAGMGLAVMPVPGATAGRAALKTGTRAMPKKIEAWHGSPHDFDEFRIEKMGTGEGAQAYGAGHYLAEAQGTAKVYRDNLREPASLKELQVGGRTVNDRNGWDYSPKHDDAVDNVRSSLIEDLMLDDALVFENDPARVAQNALDRLDEKIVDYSMSGDDRMVAAGRKLRAQLEANPVTARWEGGNPGRLYKVEIDADPDDFLDYDLPLSQQNPAVRERLMASGLYDPDNQWSLDAAKKEAVEAMESYRASAPWRNSEIADQWDKGVDEDIASLMGAKDPYEFDKFLRDIPVGYADNGGSQPGLRAIRDKMPSPSEIDQPASIIHGDGPSPVNFNSSYADDYAAEGLRRSNALADAGIPGIKYKDQMSRGRDEYLGVFEVDGKFQARTKSEAMGRNPQTIQNSKLFDTAEEAEAEGRRMMETSVSRNYVVFRDNLIRIVDKYGIAGAATMTGMSQAEIGEILEGT